MLLLSVVLLLTITVPVNGATVASSFCVQGSAAGADYVHVWGGPSSGAVFLGAATTDSAGHYEIVATGAPLGTYPVIVFAHDPVSDTFATAQQVTVTVVPSPTVVGFGGSASINQTALDDAFTVSLGVGAVGADVAFGRSWPSPPTCIVGYGGAARAVTRTSFRLDLTPAENGQIQVILPVLCGGGR
jgi:hypothetical protein